MSKTIAVLDEVGRLGDIPAENLEAALQSGYTVAKPEDISAFDKEQKYGGVGGQIASAALGAVGTASFGTVPLLLDKTGVLPSETQKDLREVNPKSSVVGDVAGIVGSSFLLPGGGLVGAAERGGAAVAKSAATALPVAEGLGAQVIKGAATKGLGLATEGAFYGAGNVISEQALGDPNLNAEKIAAHVGMGALWGGALGGLIGGAAPIVKSIPKGKFGEFLTDAKDRLKFHAENPNIAEAATKEVTDVYEKMAMLGDEVRGVEGVKAQAIEKLVPEFGPGIAKHAEETASGLTTAIKEMIESPSEYPARLVNRARKDLETFESVVTKPGVTSQEVFRATDELKRTLQDYAKPLYNKINPVASTAEDYLFMKKSASLASGLKESLENPRLWGDAANLQKVVNKAWTDFLPYAKRFNTSFTGIQGADRVIDPGKVLTFVNQAGGPRGALKEGNLKGFVDAAKQFEKVVGDAYKKLGIDSPVPHISTSIIDDLSGVKTAGAKAVDTFVKKSAADLTGSAVGAGIGATIGGTVAGPLGAGVGAFAGEHILGPAVAAVVPGITRAMLGAADSIAASKIAKAEMILNKSHKEVGNLTGQIFHKSTEVARGIGKSIAPVTYMEKMREFEQIKKRVAENTTDPETYVNKVASATEEIYKVMPSTAGSLQTTMARGVEFLRSKIPNTEPSTPLGKPRTPSDAELSKFFKYVQVVENPYTVLKQIKNNTLCAESMETMTTVYPQLLGEMQFQIFDGLADYNAKGKDLPYNTKVMLSAFLQHDLITGVTQPSLALNIASWDSPSAQQDNIAMGNVQNSSSQGKQNKITLANRSNSFTRSVTQRKDS